MGDFRLFCFGLFISMGVLAALDNHTILHVKDGAAGIMMLSLAMGALLVMSFGKRSASK